MTGQVKLDKGELVPFDTNKEELREEVNHRTHRAGYTTRSGGPLPLKIMDVVPWGKLKLNVWPRDKHGKLIE